MRLEINDDDFHVVNEFNNFFDFEYPLCASLTETACSELDRRCKNLKDNLLCNGINANIDIGTKFYRARKVTIKELSYNSDDDEERSFWDSYITGYFTCSNCKILHCQYIKKQIGKSLAYNEKIHWDLSNGYWGYRKEQCGAPPICFCSDGRANEKGERVLYLGDSIATCLLECNANREEIFSIGEFIATRPLTIYDFAESENNYCNLWLSCIFSKVSQEQDYRKTQVLTRVIREMGYDGIKYRSAKNTEGFCYAIFNPEDFECKCSYLVKPTNVSISFSK